MSVLLKLERKEWQQTGASRRLQKGAWVKPDGSRQKRH
ncbi:hypothetical protein LEP1GSC062_0196 [Leptospira alexanderi serovar Manhao 3 str. L 60]|uniref:Uncharacterized protein n=1 Tax=Leptospira alexanderi serovar Manhao 3 str. L 60 TaxID=1049759 RepID=V6I595_9LEPT|nr:hypothetical protein LEP1GSC062_0196 [Leptospira alexanderi serovar Manhao 3 str. L 60]